MKYPSVVANLSYWTVQKMTAITKMTVLNKSKICVVNNENETSFFTVINLKFFDKKFVWLETV